MKKFKLISSITMLIIVISIMIFGIVMATLSTNGIRNSVFFSPDRNVEMNIVCEATWALGENSRQEIFINKDEEENKTFYWNSPDINFNEVEPNQDQKIVAIMTFSFKNTSTEPNNVLNISFQGIKSDTKEANYKENPRYITSIQIGNGEVIDVAQMQSNYEDGTDVEFTVSSQETVEIKIYYELCRQDQSIDEKQNMIIDINVVEEN